MHNKFKKIVAMGIVAMMCVVSVPMSADAATHRDDWTTNYITLTTISNDVTVVDRNPDELYTGVCNYSNSSYSCTSGTAVNNGYVYWID